MSSQMHCHLKSNVFCIHSVVHDVGSFAGTEWHVWASHGAGKKHWWVLCAVEFPFCILVKCICNWKMTKLQLVLWTANLLHLLCTITNGHNECCCHINRNETVSSLVPRLSTPTQEPENETRHWLAVLLLLTVGLRNDPPPSHSGAGEQ